MQRTSIFAALGVVLAACSSTPSQAPTSQPDASSHDSAATSTPDADFVDAASDVGSVSPPSGNQGLLSGMTPASYTLPSGWTLVATQDFESGSVPAGQFIVGDGIVTDVAHGGTHAIRGTYYDDGPDVHLGFDGGSFGSFSELYVSYWDYMDADAVYNTEMPIAHFITEPCGSGFQELIVDRFDAAAYNASTAPLAIAHQGTGCPGAATLDTEYGPQIDVDAGTWRQFEVDYKPNTPGSSDGYVYLYVNGTLAHSATGNMNAVSMAQTDVEAGGWYARNDWFDASNNCVLPGAANEVQEIPCSEEQPATCRCGLPMPLFHRYIDDVILLKR